MSKSRCFLALVFLGSIIFLPIASWANAYQGRGTPAAANRYANIKFIWSHAGTIVGLAGRWNTGDPKMLANPQPGSRLYNLRRFYCDTAGEVSPVVMQGMKMLVGASQIVFGTDYPWGLPANIARNLQGCEFSSEELRGIDRENALKIFPKYRA
jgi:predicted TIM-barrel fold metal-dependent hydrolase